MAFNSQIGAALLLLISTVAADDYDPAKTIDILATRGRITKTELNLTKEVKVINIVESEITEIEPDVFSSLPNLEKLLVIRNEKFPKITKAFFKYVPNLIYASFYGNGNLEVDGDSFSDLKRLEYVEITDAVSTFNLKRDTFASPSLKIIQLINITIRGVDSDAFSQLPKLRTLLLCKNSLSGFKPNTFGSLKQIYYIQLCENDLEEIPWDAFGVLPSLVELDLSNNKITDFDSTKIRKHFPNLKVLRIEGFPNDRKYEDVRKELRKYKIAFRRNYAYNPEDSYPRPDQS